MNTGVRIERYQGSLLRHVPQTPEVYKKCRSANNCTILANEYRQMKLISEALQVSGNTILSPTTIPPWFFQKVIYEDLRLFHVSRLSPTISSKAKLIDLFCPPTHE